MSLLNLQLTLRFLWKNKFFTSLNIFGLTLGLTASIWLLLYLKNELTFDLHYPNHETVYRVSGIFEAPGARFNTAYSASELAPIMADEYPEITAYTRFINVGIPKIKLGDRVFNQEGIFYTDEQVFEVFQHSLLEGNPKTALQQPKRVVITKSVNSKLFGKVSGMNKTIEIDGSEFLITGIMADLPKNTHFKYNVLLAGVRSRGFELNEGTFDAEALWNADGFTYLRVTDGFDKQAFLEKFGAFNDKYFMPFGNKIQGTHQLRLQALAAIHYDKEVLDDDLVKGSTTNLIVFSAIGIAILLLACINYINMATARAALRAREIGIRKTLGSNRSNLRLSLLLESLVQVFAALILGIGLTWLIIAKTQFQQLLGVDFEFTLFQQPQLLLALLLLVALTGLISGLYPAFYLSSIKPVKALKGNWTSGKKGNWLRQTLVFFQFAISIGVLTTTLLMRDQINFLQQQDLGFEREQVMIIDIQDSASRANAKVLTAKFKTSPLIKSVTSSNFVPGVNIGQMVFMVDKDGEMKQQEFKFIHCGAEYLETLGIKLTQGKFFSGTEKRGNQYFIVNETAARLFGWDEPLGKRISFFHQQDPGQIIGVVADFNFFSLHNAIQPLVFVYNPNPGTNLLVSYQSKAEAEVIETISTAWNEVLPNTPFEYSFLDQRLRDQYQADEAQNKLITAMAGLCAIISLMGLSGLTAFNVNQRTKEIGIRKVLGAMSRQIVLLIFSNTLRLILLASLVAGPLTYLIIGRWLDNFAYRAGFNFALLILAVMAAIVLTFLIVGTHVFQAARSNPSETLRQE